MPSDCFACNSFSFRSCSTANITLCKSCLRYVMQNPKLIPGYLVEGVYVSKQWSMNRLITSLSYLPAFFCVPIALPIRPLSADHDPNGAYSTPNNSRCFSAIQLMKKITAQPIPSLPWYNVRLLLFNVCHLSKLLW